ncbi:family 10 glycosylhydrolase [Cohnella caldifontis]|uniref:family 10 glycosylhydrolase n=1 Tax=Cohnella caldifontis TaxID=3027471 RepID=UPI0023ED15F4|nr:family 10 glycosylhydrolase [Cohnella sp. YIM B05605]
MRLRKWMGFMLAIAAGGMLLTQTGHAQTNKEIRIYLDGQRIDSDVPPYIKPKVGFTMVPVRVVSQGMGATVAWTQKSQTVTVNRNGVSIVMKVGQNTATAGGKTVALDAPPELNRGRVMVPLRFIGESLGLQVEWNAANRWIQLNSKSGHEIKGAWVSTVYNLDWPSAASYGQPEKQKQEYAAMLDDLQSMGINAVYVQVRSAADALYPSKLAPWSKVLTGTPGKDPGYDPLAFMIEETHRRGMQFHAWFNPFRAYTSAASKKELPAGHAAVEHPEWIVEAGGIGYLNPGIPEARQHIIDAIVEVAKRYPVDGIHLDDYFYPSDGNFDDEAAFQAYNDRHFANKGDWRRANINDFVRKLGVAVHAANPRLAYGISPFGVWRNQADDPAGSATRASVTAYDDMYADVRTWIRGKWIDYVMPQLYWSMDYPAAEYDKLADWWADQVDGTGVKLYIGHAPYKLGTKETGWQSAEEIVNQLIYNESRPQVRGDVFFSAKDLRRNPLQVADALRAYYQR